MVPRTKLGFMSQYGSKTETNDLREFYSEVVFQVIGKLHCCEDFLYKIIEFT